MIAGIAIFPESIPAVVVPPTVLTQIHPTSSVSTELLPVSAYAAAQWQQHPNHFDRSLQEFYDMHGKMILEHESSGTQLDTLI